MVIGVSGYPNLAESLRLTGPKNDSREMANTLARLGVPAGNISVLADQVTGLSEGIADKGPATKQAILETLDRLTAESERGDLVVFYYSGHGSQQPDRDGDEQGGNDEILLPYDVGSWNGAEVENALLDDELNARIVKLLDKGIDFFGIIDACNSATGFRALPGDDARSRAVAPAELGVPDFVEGGSRGLGARVEPTASDGGKRGRAAYFYAAQENEEALEKVPPGGEPGENYAVFTYTLLARMNATPGLTYRTLHQSVMADIKRNTLVTTQTPEVEGDLLDETVLGLTNTGATRQWQIFNGKLQAGTLYGLANGAQLALYDDPAAPDDKAIAFGTLETAGATRSVVVPSERPCGEGVSAPCLKSVDEGAWKKARFARLIEPGIDFGLVLSDPVRLDPSDGHDYGPVVAALKSAVADGPLSARMSMRSSGYDIAVGLVDGKLAFSPAGGLVDRDGPGSSARLTLPSDPQGARAKIEEALERMARATALQRLGADQEKAAALGLTSKILVSRSRGGGVDGGCSGDDADYEAPTPVTGDAVFGDCDILTVDMKNNGKKPLDVTVLLIGADFSISAVWPVDGAANRILAGESKTAAILQMEADPAASTEERLVFLAVPGINQSHTAFTDLEQGGLRAVPGEEDEPEIAAARALLETALNEMSRSTATRAAGVEEEMVVEINPFFVKKGD